jgi:hypothetical protein
MVDMIAQPTTWSKTGEELLQFTLVEDDFNGRRTTHSNRVKQPNGKTIVYRTHRTKVPQIFMSVPTGQSATYTKNTVEPPQGTIGASDAPVNTAFAPQGASSPPSEVKPLTTAEQTAEANKGEDTYQFQGQDHLRMMQMVSPRRQQTLPPLRLEVRVGMAAASVRKVQRMKETKKYNVNMYPQTSLAILEKWIWMWIQR